MRLIVPDTSVMVAAFFPETLHYGGGEFDLSARAVPVARAIRLRQVSAFAPDVLLAEFLTTVFRPLDRSADTSSPDPEDVRDQTLSFFELPINRIRGDDIAAIALDLVVTEHISPPDSWFLAAAIFARAELWYSHRQQDGIVEHAERLHPGKVFTLTENRF